MLVLAAEVNATVVAAFAVGFISFISPCVLPLVPGYLSTISGVSFADISSVSGFFRFFRDHYNAITVVSGIVLIAMGVLLYSNELTRLNAEALALMDDLGINFFSEL